MSIVYINTLISLCYTEGKSKVGRLDNGGIYNKKKSGIFPSLETAILSKQKMYGVSPMGVTHIERKSKRISPAFFNLFLSSHF